MSALLEILKHDTFNEYELARIYKLAIVKTPILSGVDGLLQAEKQQILVPSQMPEHEIRITVIHEIFHYVTKNYVPRDDPDGDGWLVPTTGLPFKSIADLYAFETARTKDIYDGHYELLKEIEQEHPDVDLPYAIAIRARDGLSDWFKLDTDEMEAETWNLTYLFYDLQTHRGDTRRIALSKRYCLDRLITISRSALSHSDQMLLKQANYLEETRRKYGKEKGRLARLEEIEHSRRSQLANQKLHWHAILQNALENTARLKMTEPIPANEGVQNKIELSGRVDFHPLYRFSKLMPELADSIRARLRDMKIEESHPDEYYWLKTDSVKADLTENGIAILFDDRQSFTITASSVLYHTPPQDLSYVYFILKRTPRILDTIFETLNVRSWTRAGVQYSQHYPNNDALKSKLESALSLGKYSQPFFPNSEVGTNHIFTELKWEGVAILLCTKFDSSSDVITTEASIDTEYTPQYQDNIQEFLLKTSDIYTGAITNFWTEVTKTE